MVPNVTSTLPAVTYTKQEQHRFGMQGFNDNLTMLTALDVNSMIADRQEYVTEPNSRF